MIIILKGIFMKIDLGFTVDGKKSLQSTPMVKVAVGNNDKIDILEIDIHFLGIFDKQIIASQIE